MKIYHVTTRDNLPSILQRGLDPGMSRGKRKSVWGVVRSRVEWAIVHVLAKPWNSDAKLSDLVVIELTLPKKDVRRYKPTIWRTVEGLGCVPVTPSMLMAADDFGRSE